MNANDVWINVSDQVAGLVAQTKDRLAGLLPGVYPKSALYATTPNTSRIFAPGGTVGGQSTDPRASEGYGTATHVFRAPEGTFNPKTYVGGSIITPGNNIFGLSYSNAIVLAALGIGLWIFIKRRG